MIGSSRSYAIGMAHFQIAGGLRTLLLVCGVYLLLFFTGLSLFYYMDYGFGPRSGLSSGIVTVLMFFETVVLIILGSFRVASAIRTDISSRMIESHRLMPVPGWRAVMGYLLGGTTHAIAFGLLNVALAYAFAGVTSISFFQVTYNQVLLFCFAFFVWTLTAFGTFLFRQAYFVALAALLIGGCLLGLAYTTLPGFALLIGPLIGDTVFSFSGTPRASPESYVFSILGQAAFTALLFAGACRRYRGTYPTTFTNLQALLLMVTWCAVSFAGLALWNDFHLGARFIDRSESMQRPQIIASVAAALIFSIIPISTAMSGRVRGKLSQALVLTVCVLATVAIPLGALWARNDDDYQAFEAHPIIVTAWIAAAHVVTVWSLLVLLRKARAWMKWVTIGVGLLAFWMLPLLLELVRLLVERPADNSQGFGMLGTISPLGLLTTTWSGMNDAPSPVLGLVVQCLVAAGLGVLAMLMGKGKGRGAGPGMIAPPPVVRPMAAGGAAEGAEPGASAEPVKGDPPSGGSP